ncbi:MAG: sulfatase [Planctomycetota bacterium]|nr:sulfatase [Planctomycetota bacterium]
MKVPSVSSRTVRRGLCLAASCALFACGTDSPPEVADGGPDEATGPSAELAGTTSKPSAVAPGPVRRLRGRPHLLMVTVDTLRADHLSCYGYHRETSPNIDALAAEGVLVERAFATMGTTLPAHLSIMTGLYPHQHGYVANIGAIKSPFRSSAGRRTLAEVLKAAGYATAAFVSGPTVSSKTGIDVGFDTFDEHVPRGDRMRGLSARSRPAGQTSARALSWLAEREGDQPLFLWVHFWDPHEPNQPPEEFARRFSDDEGLEELIARRDIDPAKLAERFDPLELARVFAPQLHGKIRAGEEVDFPPVDDAAVRNLINLYDADVAYMDSHFGALVDAFRERGLYERTIVAFTADHGQSLGEHDWLEHGRIFDEVVRVPLVLRFPAGVLEKPWRVQRVVSHVDLVPTILARLTHPAVASLVEQSSGSDWLAPDFNRPWAFSQRSSRHRDWEVGPSELNGLKFGLTLHGWKYYHRPQAADELYDLSTDPGELVNVADRFPQRVEKLEQVVRGLLAQRPYSPESGDVPEDVQAEFRDILRDFGYAGDDDE